MKTLTLGFLLFLLSACASPAPTTTGLIGFSDCTGLAAILVVDSQGHWELVAPNGRQAMGNPSLPPDVALKYAQKMAQSVDKSNVHNIVIGDCPAL